MIGRDEMPNGKIDKIDKKIDEKAVAAYDRLAQPVELEKFEQELYDNFENLETTEYDEHGVPHRIDPNSW